MATRCNRHGPIYVLVGTAHPAAKRGIVSRASNSHKTICGQPLLEFRLQAAVRLPAKDGTSTQAVFRTRGEVRDPKSSASRFLLCAIPNDLSTALPGRIYRQAARKEGLFSDPAGRKCHAGRPSQVARTYRRAKKRVLHLREYSSIDESRQPGKTVDPLARLAGCAGRGAGIAASRPPAV